MLSKSVAGIHRVELRHACALLDPGLDASDLPDRVDGEGIAVDKLVGHGQELRDDPAVRVVGPLARTVDVRIADAPDGQPVALVEGEAVVLPPELAHGIRRERDEQVVFVDRDRARVPVDRRRRRVDDPVDLCFASRHQHVQRPADVRLEVVAGVLC